MKPIRTWIVLANARLARLVEHRGAGHGLFAVSGMVLRAEAPVDYSDRPGVGHSIAGPAQNANDRANPQDQADVAFAEHIDAKLHAAQEAARFDRLLVVAGPHMLGLLRKSLRPSIAGLVMAEMDRDLTGVPLQDLEEHLDGFLNI